MAIGRDRGHSDLRRIRAEAERRRHEGGARVDVQDVAQESDEPARLASVWLLLRDALESHDEATKRFDGLSETAVLDYLAYIATDSDPDQIRKRIGVVAQIMSH